MARARDISGLAERRGGLTFADTAQALSETLGRPVTAQDVYHQVIHRRVVPVYRRRVERVKAVCDEVLAVDPADFQALAQALDGGDLGG